MAAIAMPAMRAASAICFIAGLHVNAKRRRPRPRLSHVNPRLRLEFRRIAPASPKTYVRFASLCKAEVSCSI